LLAETKEAKLTLLQQK
jgi:hypothetical protein